MKAGTINTQKLTEMVLAIAERLGAEDRELIYEYVRLMQNGQVAYLQTLKVLGAECHPLSSSEMQTLESGR